MTRLIHSVIAVAIRPGMPVGARLDVRSPHWESKSAVFMRGRFVPQRFLAAYGMPSIEMLHRLRGQKRPKIHAQ